MNGFVADASKGAMHRHEAEPLHRRYLRIREDTEHLARPLSAEDQGLQSMPDASPAKWHRAHTTWFFETFVLKEHAADYRPFDPRYNYLFNSYYEAVGPRHSRPQRGLLSRPTAEEISSYRRHVDQAVVRLLQARGDDPDLSTLVELGLQHEQQHQELLLTDILHAFAQNPLLPAYMRYRASDGGEITGATFLELNGGPVTIGHAGGGFAFDNELPRHDVLLSPFRVMDRPVTNGEWLAFMEDGGYREPRLWLADGWQRAREEDWSSPLYWRQVDGSWQSMTLAGLVPIDPSEPVVHVSYYEADAFARWSGKRLPREEEWEHASRSFEPTAGNLRENGYLRPIAARGAQFFGDVWQWTQSPYVAYPGFVAPEGAIGEYNGKFMVNQMVLRGGSCVTATGHIRASYRNFFYPHQRWQFTGLRLAEDVRGVQSASRDPFLADVWSGLSAPQKALPSKYFYDGEGSRLYEKICALPEYYLTRTEMRLLHGLVGDLAAYTGPETALVEFGCGASIKTRILLNRLRDITHYVPVDICEESLKESTRGIRAEFPHLHVDPIAGDFLAPLPPSKALEGRQVLGFFPGSTIGNFVDAQAERFLRSSRSLLGESARILVGIDLVKDPGELVRAYDDGQGITAAFNKNLLVRINGALGADFELDQFAHRAIWNAAESRIEMHLVSLRNQCVTIRGRSFSFEAGETVHTENSHKYTLERFAALAGRAGWSLERSWTSSCPAYAVVLLS